MKSPTAFLYYLDFQGTPAQSWPVGEKPLVVGRGEFANACVTDDSLSRSHFMVVAEGAEFYVVDLESQNGTWVNGQLVAGGKVNSGELIRAGKSLFLFACGAAATEPSHVLAAVQSLLQTDSAIRAAA